MISLIEKNSQIPEMYLMRHQQDDADEEYDYVSDVLKNSTTKVLWQNDNMSEFMDGINKMYSTIVDSLLPVRNIFFWSYGKYYNKHGK